ncbi:hypothetical protein ACTHPF_26970 [Paenibacillus sp. SAF-054]|uniref:hypothetical protein n=1 Tax=unclassified Paenibacillus TaxID=185978 RepID=UPI003F7D7F57
MNLREQMAVDVQQTFMNPNEFAELHTVSTFTDEKNQAGQKDRVLSMIVEKFTLDGRPIQSADGVSAHSAIVHIDPKILVYTPRVDQNFYLDFLKYKVKGVSNDTGILKIVLQSNGTRP